jgi:hypothetical protein
MTFTMAPEAPFPPSERENLPVLSFRHLPPSEEGAPPAASELVRLDVAGALYKSADGTPEFWTGRGSVSFDARSTIDPWHVFTPTKILGAYWTTADFSLPLGTVCPLYFDPSHMQFFDADTGQSISTFHPPTSLTTGDNHEK